MSRYDWSDKRIPDWVQEIATDEDGEVCGYRKAYISEVRGWWVDYEGLGWETLWYADPCPDWAESKEQRPVAEAGDRTTLMMALAAISPPYTAKTVHLSPQQAQALWLHVQALQNAQGADLAEEVGNDNRN
jgi:hypothetical protein